jgi:hypothetical protein
VKHLLWLALAAFAAGAATGERRAPPPLSVAEIVAKNAEARGGLDAWRKINTMIWVGHIETARAPLEGMPFMLEMKRPRMTRFELKAPTEQTVRAFDGKNGWKARPGHNGQQDVKPFTAEELRFAKDGEGLDGLLIDCEAKGIRVALDGEDKIEGARAYRLRVELPSGAVRQVWVDAHSFLELRQDREARNAAGAVAGIVQVHYRNYQTVGGVKLPMTIETGSASTKEVDKMLIERVAMNPPLDDQRFARPHVPHSNMVTVTAEPVRPVAPPAPSRPGADSAQPGSGGTNTTPTSEVPKPR